MTDNPDKHLLSYEGKEITLIGTAHVSAKSADLVEEVIKDRKPDTVCVELCQSRYQALTEQDRWKNTDLIKVIREKKAFFLLSNFMLASIQKKMAKKLNIRPGEEMMRAIQAARSTNSNIHLADRDIRVTLKRAWHSMKLWGKLKLMVQFVASLFGMDDISEEEVEQMKNRDVLETLIFEIGESQPELKEILIDERDQYLAYKIRNAPGERIVAVVGAGHVPGIIRNWHNPIDMEAIDEMPPKGKAAGIIKWGVPAAILALMVAGFFLSGAHTGAQMIKLWVVANAALAGVGATLALAHPLTILTAIIASPITSLNPMIAAGWVAGVVEVLLGKPKVKDFESLAEDISSVKGFWRNKITRILMVVVFTNLGSSLGAFVAIPLMIKAFG